MKIKSILCGALCLLCLCLNAKDKKNVLFILVDDFGWMDTGYNGSTFYETPELDQLSKEFMRFDFCYTPSPMCSPTRVSIMTGKNPARHGVTQWLPGSSKWPKHPREHQRVLCPPPAVQGLNKNETTLGEALQQNGYETAFYGKWHMGRFAKAGGPVNHGFESQLAVIQENSCSMFYPFRNHPKYFPEAKKGDNFTDLLTNNAIKFIDKNREKPFFLYLAHFAMHTPIASKGNLRGKFEKKRQEMKLPSDYKMSRDDYAHKQYNTLQNSAEYAGELATLDKNIGRLLNHLKAKKLLDNTIVIITGDNGGRTKHFHGSPPTSVYPLRGGKTFTFEGGLRTPLLIHFPGVTKAGSHSKTPVTSMDFYPTILDMLALPQMPQQHIDGVSLLPLIKGESLKRDTLFWHFPHYQGEGSFPTSAIRQGKYKLIVNYHQNDVLLFDISKDEGETTDLSSSMPEKVKSMKKKLMEYLKKSGAAIPQFNDAFTPNAPQQTKSKK
ncbi:MAG: sulfatase [Lentisphaeraceae bacterium]|nr:sulfatase [Lentisphaeraceae bacterium]